MWSLLLPLHCPVCDAPGAAPCAACWRLLVPASPAPAPPGVDRCRSLLRYEGAGRELLARLKYRNARGPAAWLADGMAALAIAVPEEFDVVTWAPTTSARRRARGFDQAEVLARAVGRRVAKPTKPLLVRAPGAPQTGKTAAARRTGPMFSARGAAPERVLLIDDVVTSGATVSAAAFALRAAGTTSVIVITGGRTTLKVHQLPADA